MSLLLLSCVQPSLGQEKTYETVDAILSEVENKYAPDKRLTVWETVVRSHEKTLVVEGKTDNVAAVNTLRERLQQLGLSAQVKMQVLPDDSAEAVEKPWALVSVPVASMTSRPVFAAALTTQAVMGTPLRVLEYRRPFWRVQTPDGYIGWVHGMQIARLTQAELADWNVSDKIIVTARSASVSDASGSTIMTLGVGSVLRRVGAADGKVQVRLPDADGGYVSLADVQDADAYEQKWEKLRHGDEKAFRMEFVKSAKQFLGTSYLWGGTSSGGLDCSGFVSLVWRLSGVIVSRDADQQLAQSKKRAFSRPEDIEPGLLLGFGKMKEDGRTVIEHIGISLGGGDFIHSLGSVRIESLSQHSPRYSAYEAGRFLGAYELAPTLFEVPCATELSNNPFYQDVPRRLFPCPNVKTAK